MVEKQRIFEDAGVEPVRQDQLDPERATVGVGRFLPLVDPGEAMAATFGQLPYRGRDRGQLEPVEAGLETLVVACARAAADEGEESRLSAYAAIRREVRNPASRAWTI